MKKNLLLAGTMFFTVASIAFPMLGFYLLEPSMFNLLFICLMFTICVIGTYGFCEAWIKERKIAEWESKRPVIKKALYSKLPKGNTTLFVLALIVMLGLSSCSRYTTHCDTVRRDYVGYK